MKQLMGRRRLIKHIEMRDGAVYKTQFLHEVWVKVGIGTEWEQRVAKEAGGDELGSCPYDGRDHVQKIDTQKLWMPCQCRITPSQRSISSDNLGTDPEVW